MFAALQVWNDLTDDVKQTENYNVFKKKLKTFLFFKYFMQIFLSCEKHYREACIDSAI